MITNKLIRSTEQRTCRKFRQIKREAYTKQPQSQKYTININVQYSSVAVWVKTNVTQRFVYIFFLWEYSFTYNNIVPTSTRCPWLSKPLGVVLFWHELCSLMLINGGDISQQFLPVAADRRTSVSLISVKQHHAPAWRKSQNVTGWIFLLFVT